MKPVNEAPEVYTEDAKILTNTRIGPMVVTPAQQLPKTAKAKRRQRQRDKAAQAGSINPLIPPEHAIVFDEYSYEEGEEQFLVKGNCLLPGSPPPEYLGALNERLPLLSPVRAIIRGWIWHVACIDQSTWFCHVKLDEPSSVNLNQCSQAWKQAHEAYPFLIFHLSFLGDNSPAFASLQAARGALLKHYPREELPAPVRQGMTFQCGIIAQCQGDVRYWMIHGSSLKIEANPGYEIYTSVTGILGVPFGMNFRPNLKTDATDNGYTLWPDTWTYGNMRPSRMPKEIDKASWLSGDINDDGPNRREIVKRVPPRPLSPISP